MSIKPLSEAMLIGLLCLGMNVSPAAAQDDGQGAALPVVEPGRDGSETLKRGEAGSERPAPQMVVMPGTEEGPGQGDSNLENQPVVHPGRNVEAGGQSPLDGKARQAAFERSLNELIPTSPEQIQQLRKRMDQREKALTDTPPPVVHTRTECVSLQPGFAPPRIELTPNLVSVLVIVDQSGKPWPITSTTLGSGALFTAQVLDTPVKNQVVLSALTAHGNSNFVLTLAGQEIPLVVLLETKSGLTDGRQTDGMIVYQVMARGPLAPPVATKKPVTGPVPDQLYTVLDGITPQGAKLVTFSPPIEDTRIYQLGEILYLRTKHKLMWPSYQAQASGVGDFSVYEIQAVPSLMISKDGQISRIELNDASIALGGN